MFLGKVSLVLLVAILGTSWFTEDGFAFAQMPQGYNQQMMPQNQPMYQPMYQPIYQPPPQTIYVQQPSVNNRPPLIKTWDGINDWAQNWVQSGLGQNPMNGRG